MAKALQLALKNFKEHMADRSVPACFEAAEYAAWKLREAELPTQPIRAWTCRDCTPAYRVEMLAQNRCCQKDVDISKITD